MKLDIPFFPNTADRTHCWQACFRMALKYFWPDKDYNYIDLDKISQKQEGMWTSPTASFLWLINQGFQVELFEDFDYQRLVDEGEEYIYEKLGREVGDAQIAHGDFNEERKIAAEFIKVGTYHQEVPDLSLLRGHLDKGYVVISNINSAALYGHEGYAGHFIVVVGHEGEDLFIHDPGLPPRPGHKISIKDFESAWAYPTANERNFVAIKFEK